MCIHSSALLCGYSLSEYRPLMLKSFFFTSSVICLVKILLPRRPRWCSGQIPTSAVSSYWCSWNVKHCDFLHCFSAPDSGADLHVCLSPRPDYSLFPSSFPREYCTRTLHCCSSYWGRSESWTACPALFLCFPLSWHLCILRYAHLQMNQCMHHSDVFVC